MYSWLCDAFCVLCVVCLFLFTRSEDYRSHSSSMDNEQTIPSCVSSMWHTVFLEEHKRHMWLTRHVWSRPRSTTTQIDHEAVSAELFHVSACIHPVGRLSLNITPCGTESRFVNGFVHKWFWRSGI